MFKVKLSKLAFTALMLVVCAGCEKSVEPVPLPLVDVTVPLALNSGYTMPRLGLGTLTAKDQTENAVKAALQIGFRHLDCAPIYGNQREVGEGIKKAILEEKIAREQLFITSKLWNTKHEPSQVEPALIETLKELSLDYLDLYLMHWPMAMKENNSDFDDTHYIETWHAMEKLVKKGLVRSIGVSNFNRQQLEELYNSATIKPAVLQIEFNPYLQQVDLVSYARRNGLVVTAFAALGSPKTVGSDSLLTNPVVLEIAAKHNRFPAQILIRFPLQNNMSAIVGSGNLDRIKENFKVLDFKLDAEDMKKLTSLERGQRYWREEGLKSHKFYPF